MTNSPTHQVISSLAARAPGLRLLVLYGSRARGSARPESDWDLAYLADDGFDPDALLADLTLALRTDRIDLSSLSGSGGLFRYRVARDGEVLVEAQAGTFDRFWMRSVGFWCDAEPVLRRGYEGILAGYR